LGCDAMLFGREMFIHASVHLFHLGTWMIYRKF
jgi:hypothetical protein